MALGVKNPPANAGDVNVQSLGQEGPLEDVMATHSSILAWRIPWTEWPGGLQFMGLQREGHDWSNLAPTQLLQRLNLIKIRSKLSFKCTYFILIYMEKQRGGEVLAKMCHSEERRASSHIPLFPTNLTLVQGHQPLPTQATGVHVLLQIYFQNLSEIHSHPGQVKVLFMCPGYVPMSLPLFYPSWISGFPSLKFYCSFFNSNSFHPE